MKQRIITGVLAAAGFLILVCIGDIWFTSFILLAAMISFYEFVKMHQIKVKSLVVLIGFAAILYFVFPWRNFLQIDIPSFETMIWILMLLFLSITVFSKNRYNLEKISILFIGVVYLGLGFHYIAETRQLEDGLFWTFLIFSCVGITDVGAYFTGWAIGKRLLWPSISPKKTVEGAVGGIVFSVTAAILFSLYDPDLLPIHTAAMIGLIVAIIGQVGDFIQSAYKRAQGVKDSGTILPGHGGLLDRFDSWIIVFPFVHLLSLLP